MKIMWVVRPAEGGISQHLKQLSAGISDLEIVVAAPSSLEHLAEGHRFIPLNLADGLDFRRDITAANRLRQILNRENPHIVHAHGLKAALIAAWAMMWAKPSHFLFTAHNALPEMPFPIGRWGWGLVQRWLFGGMDAIISVSDAVRSQILKYVPEKKVLTIYNGISPARFRGIPASISRRDLNLKDDDLVVGTVARLIPSKGVQTLIEAVSLISRITPNLWLVVVGDGPERQKLEKYAKRLGLRGRVSFLGWRDDVPELMAGWDCFALPSLSEGFNISVLEAMASGLPVVVSDLPALREAVVAGRGGFTVLPGSAPELAAALLHLLKEREKARLMGEFNRERVNDVFAEERMIHCTRALYERFKV